MGFKSRKERLGLDIYGARGRLTDPFQIPEGTFGTRQDN